MYMITYLNKKNKVSAILGPERVNPAKSERVNLTPLVKSKRVNLTLPC